MNVYSLLDRKLRQYGALALERNDFGIQRGIADGVRQQPDAMLARHPEDFDLYQVGEFDDESGVVVPVTPPRLVVNVAELVSVPLHALKEG